MPKPRTKRIFVRVSADEHALLSTKAEAAGQTISALVRDHIGRVRVYNHADREHWLRRLTALDASVTALAKVAAAFTPLDGSVTSAYLAGIHREIAKLAQLQPRYVGQVLPTRASRRE